MLPRSFLYVPGSRPELFAKAAASGTDAVVLDLEDAVPAAQKDEARSAVARWLVEEPPVRLHDGARTWVRVDASSLAEDLDAAARPGLDGLLLAKCSPGSIAVLDQLLSSYEASRGLNRIRVVGLIEDAASLVALRDVSAHPRLTTLGVGEVDLLSDLRMARGADTTGAVTQLRLQIVVHCAAAGLAAPVAPTSVDFRDLDSFRRTTRELVGLGFRSRTAVHPAQVPVINEALTPTADEVAAARDLLGRFTSAEGGVTLDADGRLVDAAVVRGARETLARIRQE